MLTLQDVEIVWNVARGANITVAAADDVKPAMDRVKSAIDAGRQQATLQQIQAELQAKEGVAKTPGADPGADKPAQGTDKPVYPH